MMPIVLPITYKPIIEKEIKSIGICVVSSSFFFFLFFFVSYSALFFVGFFFINERTNS